MNTPQVHARRAIGGVMRLDVDGMPTGIGVQGRITRVNLGDVVYEPAEIEAEINAVKTYIDLLDSDYRKAGVDPNLLAGWEPFFREWSDWYGTGPSILGIGGPSTFWGSNRAVALRYRDRAEAFRSRLAATGAVVAAPEAAGPKGSRSPLEEGLADIGTYLKWGAAIVIGAVALSIAVPAIKSSLAKKK